MQTQRAQRAKVRDHQFLKILLIFKENVCSFVTTRNPIKFLEKNVLVASTNRRILFVQVKTSEKSLQVSNFISPLAFYTTFDEFQNCFLQSTQN